MVFEKTLAQLKFIGLGILYLAIAIAFIYIISYIIIRHKKNKELEDLQQEIMREGRANAKKLHLRHLFTSNNYKNPVNEGKIISYVLGKDNGQTYSIFAVKQSPLSSIMFYRVGNKEHTELFRDVTLKEWNFGMDDTGTFLVSNNNTTNRRIRIVDDKEFKVDTVANLSPLVGKGILANFIHRIRVRERKLIKLPEEEMKL
jgi:hypothetical protein